MEFSRQHDERLVIHEELLHRTILADLRQWSDLRLARKGGKQKQRTQEFQIAHKFRDPLVST
jgi:hypothetical protein